MTRLEHIGIAVENAEPVRELLSNLLGIDVYKTESVPSEGVSTHFVDVGAAKVELLESEQKDSAVERFLRRRGEGVHHLAFEVDDLPAVWDRAKALGLNPINPSPKAGADGKQIFFLHPKETHGILIEICRRDRFAGDVVSVPMPHGSVGAFHSGPPDETAVLLLHNAGRSTHDDFDDVIASLDSRLQIVAFDAPGHGASSEWQAASHFLRAADKHARVVLDHFDVGRACAVGTGLGAAVAASFALNFPDRVCGLVMIDPNLLRNAADLEAASQSIRAAAGPDGSQRVSVLESTLADAAEAVVSLEALVEIAVPVLVVGVDALSLPRTQEVQQVLTHSALAVVPEWSDRKTILAQILFDFVTRHNP
jgi:methylmalonyl-CoA epimerase